MTQNNKDVSLPTTLKPMSWKIGSVQTQDIQGDTNASLNVICLMMKQADKEDVDVLCFPECFLQGYTLDKRETEERALDTTSDKFKVILSTLASYNVTIVLGFIEKDNDNYYNTAAVIRHGKLLDSYRKVHLFEHNFQPGEAYPVFTVNNLCFGVNICYDARFSEGALELSAQGAKVIFYPLNNRLTTEKAISYRHKHTPNLVERAKESGCFVVSSDIITQDDTHTGYGCTAIVDSTGNIVAQVLELSSGFITAEINITQPDLS